MKYSVYMCGLRVGAVALAACLAVAATIAHADDRGPAPYPGAPQDQLAQGNDDRSARRGRNQDGAGPYIPLESIIGGIQARTPGRLVGVRGPNGAGHYRIIWETPDGRVITFIVDARTGQILR
jgi:uncharacterized membrane protein YkoI